MKKINKPCSIIDPVSVNRVEQDFIGVRSPGYVIIKGPVSNQNYSDLLLDMLNKGNQKEYLIELIKATSLEQAMLEMLLS